MQTTFYKRLNGVYDLALIPDLANAHAVETIAHPLPERSQRESMRSRYAVTTDRRVNCGSHDVRVYSVQSTEYDKTRREIIIAVQHGGGIEYVRLPSGSTQIIEALKAGGDETTLYWALRAMLEIGEDAARAARTDAVQDTLTAYAEKRIRKSTAQGRTTWKVESRADQERRLNRAGRDVPARINPRAA